MSSHRASARVLTTISVVVGALVATSLSEVAALSDVATAKPVVHNVPSVAVPSVAVPSVAVPSVAAIAAPAQVTRGQATLLGATSTAQPVRLVLGLKTPRAAAEEAFLASLQDKSSPNFHKYLSAAQWNARFAPSAAAEATVVSWATEHGLTITNRFPNRLVVDVLGSVGTIQRAFGVKINNYRLGAKRFYSNDRSVKVSSSLAPVLGSVQGMNSLQQLTPNSTEAPNYPTYVAGPAKQFASTGGANGSRTALAKAMAVSKRKQAHTLGRAGALRPNTTNGFYDPTDLYSSQAYDVDALNAQGHCCNPNHVAGGSPPASSIAISTAGKHNASDYAGFHNQYPYLAYHYVEYYIDGTPTTLDGEGTLDFEWSTAMANSFNAVDDTATVYMYDGVNSLTSTFTDIWNTMLSDGHARTMSTSYSCAESYCYDSSTVNTDHNIFNAMVGQGWTLVGDANDQGPYADCAHVSVSYPGSDPDLVSAGGTTLQAAGIWQSEVAWTGGTAPGSCNPPTNNGGGGGGCSVFFGKPGWQSVATQCSNRAEPDVSLNAAIGQNFYFNGSLSPTGGTSIVAPELAGIFAQTNAYLVALGNVCSGSSPCPTIGDPHYDIYGALNSSPHHPFYDITAGCTSNNVGGGWCAGTGYDLATGLGSANLFQLARSIAWFNVPESTDPTVSISGPGGGYHNGGTLSWTVADSGGSSPATGVAGYSYRWDADPGDPVSAPHGGSGNSFYSGPIYRNTIGSTSLASAGQGCHTLYVRAWDNIGESGLSTYTTCYDPTAPSFSSAPSEHFVIGQYSHGHPPVETTWNASDALSGIQGYQVYRSDDGGSFVYQGFQTGRSITQYLDSGHHYQYKVIAFDNASNTATSTTANFGLHSAQEFSSAIAYSTGWTTAALQAASGHQVKYATGAGKTAKFTFSGKRIAFVTTDSPTRGSATVKLDSGTPVTVNAHTSSTKASWVGYVGVLGNTTHTLTVKVLGTSGSPRFDVDSFVYID